MLNTRRLCFLILTIVPAAPPAALAQQAPKADLPPVGQGAFKDALGLSYLELFDGAAGLEFSATQSQRMRDYVKAPRKVAQGIQAAIQKPRQRAGRGAFRASAQERQAQRGRAP